jgi:hypothetical protein
VASLWHAARHLSLLNCLHCCSLALQFNPPPCPLTFWSLSNFKRLDLWTGPGGGPFPCGIEREPLQLYAFSDGGLVHGTLKRMPTLNVAKTLPQERSEVRIAAREMMCLVFGGCGVTGESCRGNFAYLSHAEWRGWRCSERRQVSPALAEGWQAATDKEKS